MRQVSTHRIINEVRRIIASESRRRTRVQRQMMDPRAAAENLERDLQQLKEMLCETYSPVPGNFGRTAITTEKRG